MKEEGNASATNSFRLKGFEKSMFADTIRIAHVLHTSLSSSSDKTTSLKGLLTRAPLAWKWVTARHPRMRARVSETIKGTPEATVYPILSESALAASLIVLEDENTTSWKDYVLKECHKPRLCNDTVETLFSITLLPNSKENNLVFMLFSDHVLSDGFSGYVILRDFLHVLTNTKPSDQDAEYLREVPTSLPLQKPIYEQLIPRTFLRQLYDKFVAGCFLRVFSLLAPQMKTIFHKSPKLSHDQSCTQHFASGSVENLQKALEICRSEKTTLVGPICIAITLGMAKATGSIENDTTHIKSLTSIDYNLRNRVGMGKEHVGMNIGISSPMVFNTPGLALDAPFWETARNLKQAITQTGDDAAFHGTTAFQEHIHMDRLKDIGAKLPHGIVSDVNISNLGRWPFGHSIGPLSMDEVYLYHHIPRQGMAIGMVFFVTSIHSLQYSMTSILDDATTMDAIFDMVVQIVESVGSIGPTTTLRDILQRVTLELPSDGPTE